jgi:hypothetical protein
MKPVVEAAELEGEEESAASQQQQQQQKCNNSIRKIRKESKTTAAMLMAPLMKVRCSRWSTYLGRKSGVITNGLELINQYRINKLMYSTKLVCCCCCYPIKLFY